MSNENARKEVSAKGQTEKLGHCGLVTNDGQEKWVRVVCGCRGKKIVKDVMETWSCEYGFISNWINHRYYGSKEAIGLKIVLCKSEACCG